jgi:hypothetical protein
MTQPREIEHVLDTWFVDGPRELSDRALTDALSEIDHTRQLGAHVVPWRYNEMPTPVRLLLVAALMAVSAAAAVLISGGARNNQPTPSPSPSPTSRGPGESLGSTPAGDWTTSRAALFGSEAGTWTLDVTLRAGRLFASDPSGRETFLGTTTTEGEGRTALGPTDSCPSTGHYSHQVSDDSSTFTITVGSDACVDRSALLSGVWARQWVEHELTPEKRYRMDTGGALVDVTVPRSFVNPNGGYTDYDGVPYPMALGHFRTHDWVFAVFMPTGGPSVGIDRCHGTDAQRSLPSTIDQYLAWSRASNGLDVGEPVHLTVAGHPAVRVDLTGVEGCQGDDGSVQPGYLIEGMQTREWAIDLDGRLLLALVTDEDPMEFLSPEVIDAGEAFIESMEITPTP